MKIALHLIVLITMSGLVIGCSPSLDELETIHSYKVSHRQLPPDPTYNRLRWAHLPEMYPAKVQNVSVNRPRLLPVMEFSITDKPVCDAATMLAGSARYSSYCSSLLKHERITLSALGTIDELAEKIEDLSSARVVVDHVNREVRFLLHTGVQERFLDEEQTDEY